MTNPMDGNFLGGGALKHTLVAGDVYISTSDLATLLGGVGYTYAAAALASHDPIAGACAHTLLTIAQKAVELESELLKQEAEKLFGLE